MMTTFVNRFSQPVAEALRRHEDELVGFSERVTHLLSVEQELRRVTRGKFFVIYHEPMYRTLLGERDMVVVDLASWARGFYKKAGRGLLRHLRGSDQQALKLKWKYEGSSVISLGGKADDVIEDHVRSLNRAWRAKAFSRLFPNGTTGSVPNVPCQQDIDALCDRLAAQFKSLHDDRNQHRAHRYENGPKTAAMLSLADVTKHLEACQCLLADLRCLSSNSQFTSHHYEPKAHEDDRYAQDVVDLILLGSLRTIIDADYGPKSTPASSPGYYWQRRTAHYERLHALHEASGALDKPFNNRALIPDAWRARDPERTGPSGEGLHG